MVDGIVVGGKLSSDGLHKQHLEVGLVDVLHVEEELVAVDLVQQLVAVVVLILPLLVQQDQHLSAFEVLDKRDDSRWEEGYFSR